MGFLNVFVINLIKYYLDLLNKIKYTQKVIVEYQKKSYVLHILFV